MLRAILCFFGFHDRNGLDDNCVEWECHACHRHVPGRKMARPRKTPSPLLYSVPMDPLRQRPAPIGPVHPPAESSVSFGIAEPVLLELLTRPDAPVDLVPSDPTSAESSGPSSADAPSDFGGGDSSGGGSSGEW